jgi:tuberous sclerosis protein 2
MTNSPAIGFVLLNFELQSFIYPVLIALVPYHTNVDSEREMSLIIAIKRGLMTKSSGVCCIDALTMSALEMTDTMHKIIPTILSELARMSATVPIALPVLLFLSSKFTV